MYLWNGEIHTIVKDLSYRVLGGAVSTMDYGETGYFGEGL